jgi:hypothetical protein
MQVLASEGPHGQRADGQSALDANDPAPERFLADPMGVLYGGARVQARAHRMLARGYHYECLLGRHRSASGDHDSGSGHTAA